MSSNLEQDKLDKILLILTEIRDILKKVIDTEQDKGNPILVHESVGTCPECSSSQVDLGTTRGIEKYPVYHCRDCETVWVNSEDALVK